MFDSPLRGSTRAGKGRLELGVRLALRRVAASSAWFAGLACLGGCGFTDDYFVDRGAGGGGGITSGGGGGSAGVGTSSQSGAAGLSSTGGSSGLGGNGAAAGAASCGERCPAGRGCSAGACEAGWLPMAAPPAAFVARSRPAFTIFAGKLFVFGGIDGSGKALNTGAIYDPATDTWSLVAVDAATPSARELASVVSTGSQLLVFGGRSGTVYLQSGALYDPLSDTWSAISDGTAPRAAPALGAIGSELLIWGGLTTGGEAAPSPERYDLTSDSWRPAATQNGPNPLYGSSWAFGADAFFAYGGQDDGQRQDAAYRYDLAGDSWQTLPRGPAPRSFAFSAFDGSAFYVWGGRDQDSVRDDGSVFTERWTAMTRTGAPSQRSAAPRQGGWAFALGAGDVAFLGGQRDDGEILTDGGRFQLTGGWTSIPSWPSGQDHDYGVAAFSGREVLVWGGVDGSSPTRTGERWAP